MRSRPAPRDEHGLAFIPENRDCIGEACPVARQNGSCFTDRHHLHFPYAYYTRSVSYLKDFYEDPHNIIRMARCRHNSAFKKAEHNRWSHTEAPKKDVVMEFLRESKILLELGVKVANMSDVVGRLGTSNLRNRLPEEKIPRAAEIFQLRDREFSEIYGRIGEIELIPGIVVASSLEFIHAQRERIFTSPQVELLVA